MQSRIAWGATAGLIAGLVFGVMMQTMNVPTPQGGQMPMMGMVAMVVRSSSITVGWIYHLFNSLVIGAIFGGLLGTRATSVGNGLGWGALYGVGWWILGSQILMPLALGMPPFASVMMPPMRMIAVGSLIGHVIYGLILGGLFPVFVKRPRPVVA
jgi:uncharacterized membrane protein YagU involved in acid resistance